MWVAFLEGSDTFYQKVSNMKIIYSMQNCTNEETPKTQHSTVLLCAFTMMCGEQTTSQSVSDS